MSSTPVEERIATAIVTRIGDDPSFESVTRVNRDATDWLVGNDSVAVRQGSAVRLPELDYPGNPPAIAYELTFAIVGFIRQPDRTTSADDIEINTIAANIKKAIVAGLTSTWHTFGGICFDAGFGETANFVTENGAHTGAVVELTCRYRVSETDPYQVRA